jgi:hypothetical protein
MTMQTKGIDLNLVTPGAYQPLLQLNKQITQSGLSKSGNQLIQVSVSLFTHFIFPTSYESKK